MTFIPQAVKAAKSVVRSHDKNLILDPRNEAFAVGVSSKIEGRYSTDEVSVTLIMPPGAKERWRKRGSRDGEIPKRLSDGKVELKTDIVEKEMPEVCLDPTAALSNRFRPWSIGMEIGRLNGGLGSAGMIFRMPKSGEREGFDLVSSCWHVVYNPSKPTDMMLGQPMTQPHGSASDVIGTIWRAAGPKIYNDTAALEAEPGTADFILVKLTPSGNPSSSAISGVAMDQTIDSMFAALADPTPDAWEALLPHGVAWAGFPHNHRDFDNRIVTSVGEYPTLSYAKYPKGLGTVNIGDEVWKTGRTTNTTHGTVSSVHVTTWVMYNQGRFGMLQDCFWVNPTPNYARMCAPGDSGSAVFDTQGPYCVGTLFAGGGKDMVALPIQNCLAAVLTPEECRYLNLNSEA